jgi:hypothetical protein
MENDMLRKRLFLIPVLALALSSCANNSADLVQISLAPIPYVFEVPSDIAKRLTIENMELGTSSDFTKQAKQAGAIAQMYINYTADDGSVHGFAGVYYFKKADFETAQNPNEPPIYGSKVVGENEMVLAIAGPQDSIFEPTTQDGKNVSALYTLVYDPKSFKYS